MTRTGQRLREKFNCAGLQKRKKNQEKKWRSRGNGKTFRIKGRKRQKESSVESKNGASRGEELYLANVLKGGT